MNIKKIAAIILLIIILVGIGLITNKIYTKFFQKEVTPVTTTIEKSENATEVKKLVNDNSNADITDYQAGKIASTITKINDNNRTPDYSVKTTGSQYQQVAKTEGTKNKADAVIITPAKGSKDVSEIKDTDNVTLNQYNIKAYPEKEIGITIYSDREISVDYQKQVKILGSVFYAGPAVKISADRGVAVGVRISKPF